MTSPEWWELIDEVVAAREAQNPDPWADADPDAGETALTDDQEAFLAGLADQPAPPRIADPDDPG